MTLAHLFLMLAISGAVLGIFAMIKRWYRSCEEGYSQLVGPRHGSQLPAPHYHSGANRGSISAKPRKTSGPAPV